MAAAVAATAKNSIRMYLFRETSEMFGTKPLLQRGRAEHLFCPFAIKWTLKTEY